MDTCYGWEQPTPGSQLPLSWEESSMAASRTKQFPITKRCGSLLLFPFLNRFLTSLCWGTWLGWITTSFIFINILPHPVLQLVIQILVNLGFILHKDYLEPDAWSTVFPFLPAIYNLVLNLSIYILIECNNSFSSTDVCMVQFLSVLDSDAAFNSEIIRECYEAFALYCFERYLIACLGMSNWFYDRKIPLTVPVICVDIFFKSAKWWDLLLELSASPSLNFQASSFRIWYLNVINHDLKRMWYISNSFVLWILLCCNAL